jgi:hypothetical protein
MVGRGKPHVFEENELRRIYGLERNEKRVEEV